MKKVLFILLTTSIFTSCVKLPETGKSAFILTSPVQEAKLGQDGYKEVLSQSKINKDPRLNAMLQRVGKRIASQVNQKDFKWEFTIIESKEQNAWCMPGGKVAFYTGIFPHLKNEAGMAAVMGHEVAHAVLRHAGERISKTMILQMGLSAADISLGNSQNKGLLIGLLGAGGNLAMLKYSREDESESDIIGLKYMSKAGYDPMEAVRFWERFKAAGGGAPPEFLSTHPSGETRIQDLKAQMPKALQFYRSAPEQYGIGENI